MPFGNLKYAQWGGQACNPYDTERVAARHQHRLRRVGRRESGDLLDLRAGLRVLQRAGSRNNVVNLLTTKGIMMDGGIGSKKAGDRAGIHCRTVSDAASVLDAIKGYESDDMFTAIPKALIPKEPYASFLVADKDVKNKPLKGMRVGIVREFMVKHTKNDAAISDQIDKEIKTVLRDKLGAELVESVDPLYPDDPAVPNMKYTFQDAFAEILPHNVPEYFWQKTASGELEFAVPGLGRDVRSTMRSRWRLGKAPLSREAQRCAASAARLGNPSSPFTINKYLAERGDARVKDWASWVANAKFENDEQRAGAENAVGDQDPRRGARQRQLPEDAVGAADGGSEGDVREQHRRVRQPGADDAAVQAGRCRRAGGQRSPARSAAARRSRRCSAGPEIDVPAGYTPDRSTTRSTCLTPDKKAVRRGHRHGRSRSCRIRCRSA